MEWTQIFIAIAALVFLVYKYGSRNQNLWKSKGIKQTNPLPFVGDCGEVIFKRMNIIKFMEKLYNSYKNSRFFGIYVFLNPCLLVRDPDLLKQIMIKDAEYFINRHNWFSRQDPIIKKKLIFLQDEKWKNLRTVMTTAFTSAKMKDMFNFMKKCADESVANTEMKFNEKIKSQNSDADVLELNIKDLFSRYGTDAVVSTAFGLELNSFKNPNNEFYEAGTAVKNSAKTFPIAKLFFIGLFSKLAKTLNIKVVEKNVNSFFTDTISETIRNREENNIIRKDIIHVLMEARKGKGLDKEAELARRKLPEFTDLDITSQIMAFFFGGFDTMATALAFASYELALHPDIQDKLHEEIDSVLGKEDEITYDAVINQMSYLDMVIKEVLRKWPPLTFTDREVSKPYIFPKSEDSPEFTLNRGDTIFIPILAIHRDPNNFPNPDKFDPERFRDEKSTIKPFTYLPFGGGLRQCIAVRYALMEIKIGLVSVLKNYSVVPTERTPIPFTLKSSFRFELEPEENFILGLKPRRCLTS